jgi:hypothetical protein
VIAQATGVVGLRLALEKRRSNIVFDDGVEYALKLVDINDTEVMRFVLPQSFVDDIRSEIADLELFMSLDGSISIVAPDSEHPLSSASVGLDELVVRDLSAEMLRDEPNLKAQLSELRRKLTDALALVDRTLADLDKPDA